MNINCHCAWSIYAVYYTVNYGYLVAMLSLHEYTYLNIYYYSIVGIHLGS